ncbi:hypothetical protein PAEPH01_0412 [Pancytospora epiphaga]|nr:hypothetical protein PAEPH01_0412 [Pancytospora epiphaga]
MFNGHRILNEIKGLWKKLIPSSHAFQRTLAQTKRHRKFFNGGCPMNFYVIAVGDPEVIKTTVGDFQYAQEDDTFVLSVPPKDQQEIIKKLQKEGISAYTHADYLKILRTGMRFFPLREYDASTVYDWQKTGTEYFGMTFSDEFELCSIDKKDVTVLNRVEPISRAYFSNTGAVIGFIRKTMASFHVNESLDKIFDVKIDSEVIELVFGRDDRYMAVRFVERVDLYDIMLGKQLYRSAGTDCCFSGGSAYFQEGAFLLDKQAFEPYERATKIAADKTKFAKFVDGPLQKIIFMRGTFTQVKNHSNISDVDFYFSESKMYALITKVINGKPQYFFESYSDKDITINKLDSLPQSVTVEDNGFIICNTKWNITFYKRGRYNYAPVKSIDKNGTSIVAMHGSMACVYDSSSQTIEFYDKVSLRSVYAHCGCTSIVWSQSGLYVAAFSNEEAPTSLVQIFNCNGKLMHRKTYSKFTAFQWRPFISLLPEEEVQMEPFLEDGVEEELSDTEVDVSTLLSEWKCYLLAKIQSIEVEGSSSLATN